MWPKWWDSFSEWEFAWVSDKNYPSNTAITLYINNRKENENKWLPNESIFMWFPDDYWRR